MRKFLQIVRRRRRWICAAVLIVLVQSMYPSGFMPSSLADGWPMALCPQGLPMGFLSDDHHHGHLQHGDQQQRSQLGEFCPIGCGLDVKAAPTLVLDLAPVLAAANGLIQLNLTYHVTGRITGFESRAPPLV